MKKVIRVSESNLVKLIQKVLVEEKHINPKKLNEQGTPGGVTQDAVNKILAISKQNKARLSGSYLAPLQQSNIDKEFGKGTYEKFFNGGGKDILDAKKIEPKKDDSKPQIVIPSGVSQDAVNKILAISKQNKARLSGSYLAPLQQSNIDKEFGEGTYEKFFNGGGKDVLNGEKIFKTAPMTADQQKTLDTLTSNREKQLLAMYKSVKNGIIVNPSSVENGTKWTDFLTAYKVTQDELNKVIKSGMTNMDNKPKVDNKPKGNLKPKVVRNYTTMLAEI